MSDEKIYPLPHMVLDREDINMHNDIPQSVVDDITDDEMQGIANEMTEIFMCMWAETLHDAMQNVLGKRVTELEGSE
jgi:hypothetical protein